jgi:hypothetical protein
VADGVQPNPGTLGREVVSAHPHARPTPSCAAKRRCWWQNARRRPRPPTGSTPVHLRVTRPHPPPRSRYPAPYPNPKSDIFGKEPREGQSTRTNDSIHARGTVASSVHRVDALLSGFPLSLLRGGGSVVGLAGAGSMRVARRVCGETRILPRRRGALQSGRSVPPAALQRLAN